MEKAGVNRCQLCTTADSGVYNGQNFPSLSFLIHGQIMPAISNLMFFVVKIIGSVTGEIT